MKILMVCLGNICRSPLAEGIFKQKLVEKGFADWLVDSAGIGGWHAGEQPDRRAIATARQHGVDISEQRARQFWPGDFDRFDIVFAMDKSNLAALQRLARTDGDRQKISLLVENEGEVPDPYYDDAAFEPVFHLIDAACEKALKRLL